ncbi:unnamed protein product [Gordionus sp. m RMFG-2023]
MENIMMKLLFGDKKKSEKQPLKKVKQKGKIRQLFEKLVKKKSIDLKGSGETNVNDDISNINAMIVPDTANLLSGCLKHKEKSPAAHKEGKINIIDMLKICIILDKQKWVKLNNNKKDTFPDISMGGDDKSGQCQYRLKPLDFNELDLSANRESKMNICDWTNYKVLITPKPKLSEFRCHGVVGSGEFGMEFKVKLRNSTQEYALKFLNRRYFNRYENFASVRCIRSEINVLKTNKNHPFLVGLYAFYQTPRNYIIVRDFTSGGDLRSLLKRYGRLLEDHAIFYSAQIVIAIKYLHDNGIIHRDIKPESILLDRKGYVKLGNFVYCKEGIAKDEMVKGFCGTIPYMAPEIMRNEYYDFNVDWYSFGVVLYELLIGPVDLLGSDEATSRYYQAILSGPWRVSVEATSILNGFLNMNPEERLGSNLENGFNDIFSHSFFASINWDRLQKKELYPPYKPKRNMKFGVLRYFFDALLYLAYMKDLM